MGCLLFNRAYLKPAELVYTHTHTHTHTHKYIYIHTHTHFTTKLPSKTSY